MNARLAEMTARDVAQAVAGGVTTVILPLGATEQHGHHLPLGTDAFLAGALAEALAEELGNVMVAPVMPLGCSDEHTGFSGLLSVDHETLALVIADCALRIAAWGVRRLVLLSAHGGNQYAMDLALARMRDRQCPIEVVVCASSTRLGEELGGIAREDGISTEARGLHAGEGETSEMLHVRPDLVRLDRLEPGYTGPLDLLMPRLRQVGVRAVSANGVLGDPREAGARRGERYLQAQVSAWRSQIESGCERRGAEVQA